MPPVTSPPSQPQGRAYWRSLEHLADTPEFREFMHREFPAGASELLGEDRRQFLRIMGASMALAGLGLSGCRRWPQEEIVPFASRPQDRTPGVPMHYATSMDLGGVSIGLLATSHDGRPTKLEGNPEHPVSQGAADAFAQASILDLYDPDRSRTPRHNGEVASGVDFDVWAESHFKTARNKRGNGLAVLAEASSSPSLAALRRRFLEVFPNATWHEYESLNDDNVLAGTTAALGGPHRVHVNLEAATTIVSLDDDLLGTHPNAVANIRGFARGRKLRGNGGGERASMSRMYVVESDMTLTGANADHRLPVRSSAVGIVAAALAAEVLGDDSLRAIANDPAAAAVLTPAVREAITHAAEDLRHAGRGALVTAGARQPAEVHVLAHAMNAALGSAGNTVTYTPQSDRTAAVASLRELAGKKLDTLVILGGNPVYDAPADIDIAAVIDGAGTSVHLGDYVDETAVRCTWHVNRAHFLESWGDGRAWDGTYSVCQPIIEPLFAGRSAIELLAMMLGAETTDGQTIVKTTFAEMTGTDDDRRWQQTLHDGFLSGSASTPVSPRMRGGAVAGAASGIAGRAGEAADGWEVVFAPHPTVLDGRFANNGWLQETARLPDLEADVGQRGAHELRCRWRAKRTSKPVTMVRRQCERRSARRPVRHVAPATRAGGLFGPRSLG